MFRKLGLGVCIVFAASALFAANKEQKRLENSGTVMQEVMGVPDNIPQELLEKAECVIVFPSVLKGAFIVGGSYGRAARRFERHTETAAATGERGIGW